MAESDINNFSSSSPHRLPTRSASDALQSLTSGSSKCIPTGLSRVDAVLQRWDDGSSTQQGVTGGLSRGQVTEIYGPPGVGKTSFARNINLNIINRIEVCGHALRSGDSVAYVDCSHSIAGSRLKEIVLREHLPEGTSTDQASPVRGPEILDNFHHFTTPTLPHLLALLTHASPSFPPSKTSLIIIDSVSTLFNLAFPKFVDAAGRKQNPNKVNDASQWAVSRRWTVMGDFIAKIAKLAAIRHIAILLTMQTATRVYADTETCIYPAVAGNAWDNGINARILLFRDWLFRSATASSQEKYEAGTRYAAVVKAGGVSYDGLGKAVPFKITKVGLESISSCGTDFRFHGATAFLETTLKRKRDEAGYGQSDDGDIGSDEEFGWTENSAIIQGEEKSQ